MSKREAIMRYGLIIRLLRKRPASFKEINDYLERESQLQGYNLTVSKRTYQRDLDEIRSLYNIDIQFDFSKLHYFIEYEENEDANVNLLEAFDTFNAFRLTDRIASHVYFEKRKPRGTENLYGLIHAIENRIMVGFNYFKFYNNEKSSRKVAPLALKEYRNRWYLLAKGEKDEVVKSFGLDRISNLEISQDKINDTIDFDADKHYKYCFGVISPDKEEPEDILLLFTTFQWQYIKSMPLHHTQQKVKEDEKGVYVRLRLFITHDFIMELLSMGANIEVIEPSILREQIKNAHSQAIERYK